MSVCVCVLVQGSEWSSSGSKALYPGPQVDAGGGENECNNYFFALIFNDKAAPKHTGTH